MGRLALIYVIVFLLFTLGCRKEIPFNSEVTTPKLVVNSLFASDSSWAVHVSKSLSVIDQGNLDDIENATVVISTAAGDLVETLAYNGNGNYIGTQIPQEGQNYRVDVAAPNYTAVYGEDVVPDVVNVQSVDTMTTVNGEEEILVAQITFKDPEGINNYYRFSVEMGYWNYWFDGAGILDSNYYEEMVWMQLNDPSFEGTDNNTWSDIGIMSDLLFDGQTKTVDLPISMWLNGGLPFHNYRIEFIDVYFSNVSETTHFFNRSFQLYQQTQGNPFAQPVQVYSNITNGFGVFGGSDTEVYRIN
ncbi:MAG: DUF4249 domain-containing protein [Flavobacteriales bacterium]|jgi:hypothetical protein|nr:DUF4249 domain-containing protein [Flavobacteriales bacterium]